MSGLLWRPDDRRAAYKVDELANGLARRFQVPSLERQAAKMIEVVQNHTPHVMVMAEIGQEVAAARTTKQRGVR